MQVLAPGGKLLMKRFVLLWCVFVVVPLHAQQWDWVRRWTNGTGAATSLDLDAAGAVYVAGEFQGTNQLGTNTLVSAGGTDVFVAKLDGAGNVLWAIATGGTNDDRASRLLVSSNGTLYLCGRFDVAPSLLAPAANTNDTWTNVFLARLDEGRFAWARGDSGVRDATATLDPDETPWVLARSNQVFLHHYTAAGGLVQGTRVGESDFDPRGVAVDTQNRVFIAGVFISSVDLGATNLSYHPWTVFTARLEMNGLARWAWALQQDAADSGGLAIAPDGNVVLAGKWGTGLPQDYGFVVKHSPDGELLWRYDYTDDFKGRFRANALFIDRNGIIHVAGQAIKRFRSGSSARQEALWLFDLAPNGQKLSDSYVVNYTGNSPANALAISVNAAGDTFVAGAIGNAPLFGTNRLSFGPDRDSQPFVARRPTILPELRIARAGTNVSLHWPRTALPLVVQSSASMESNTWTDVAFPQTSGPKEFAVPANASHRFFRLRSTNEVPINHAPQIFYVRIEQHFLGRTNVAITVSNMAAAVRFVAAAEDEDETTLQFSWWNHGTGAALSNGAAATRIVGPDDRSFWIATWTDPATAWPLGSHIIRFVASDGAINVTNVFGFEVITARDAVSQLMSVVAAATTEPERAQLLAPLQFTDSALASGNYTSAASHLDEFISRVRGSSQLSTSDAALFESSASVLKGVLPAGS
jgi:hypothetical protein